MVQKDPLGADVEGIFIPQILSVLDGGDCWAGLICPGDGPAQNSELESLVGQVLSSGKEVVEHTLLKGILGPNDVNTSQEAFKQRVS